MTDARRTTVALVAAIALVLALSHADGGIAGSGGPHGAARVDAVSRLHSVSPAARLRAAEARLALHRPALAAVASAAIAALALTAFGAADVLRRTPDRHVGRGPAASRGPPR